MAETTGDGERSTSSRARTTRARLLEAAVRAFAEKGFHGTSTRDITLTSGLSTAALYVHFHSKEDILYAISRAGHLETLRVVKLPGPDPADPVARLRTLVREFVAYHAREHTTARIVNYELSVLSAEHLAELRDIRREIDREIQGVVAAGIDAGVFHVEDPRLTTVMLLSMGIDIGRWYSGDGPWPIDVLADRYADMALRLVGYEADDSTASA